WNEELPHAGTRVQPHRVAATVPVVEVAHYAHPLGVRGPDGESDAGGAIDGEGMGTQLPVELNIGALSQQVQVQLTEGGRERVRISELLILTVRPPRSEPVGEAFLAFEGRLEEPGVVHSLHLDVARAIGRHDAHR